MSPRIKRPRRTRNLWVAKLIAKALSIVEAAVKAGNLRASYELLSGLGVLERSGRRQTKKDPALKALKAALDADDVDAALELLYRVGVFGRQKHLLIQRKIELLDERCLLRQFRALEEHKDRTGNIQLKPAYGHKDDLAVTVALAAFELSNRRSEPGRCALITYGPNNPGSPFGQKPLGPLGTCDWRRRWGLE